MCTFIDYSHVPLFLSPQLQNSGWTRSMKRVTFVGPAGWNAWLDSFFTVNLFGHACRMKFVSWPESRAYFLHYKLAVIIGFFVDLSAKRGCGGGILGSTAPVVPIFCMSIVFVAKLPKYCDEKCFFSTQDFGLLLSGLVTMLWTIGFVIE